MKSMLITATAVGAALAGLLLYWEKKTSKKFEAIPASDKSQHALNEGLEEMVRPSQHAMG